jgi:hypothetical protein
MHQDHAQSAQQVQGLEARSCGCVLVHLRRGAGNVPMTLKLTPAVAEDNSRLRLVPEVAAIEADGSLGELLCSGPPTICCV